jgi:Fe-S cluster assembly ATPase SufC
MVRGEILENGGADLAKELEEKGYSQYGVVETAVP